MTVTPDPKPRPAVTHRTCPLLALRRTNPGFDVPCACGHISDQCTQRSDGTCDG